jgi:hypothetical protein
MVSFRVPDNPSPVVIPVVGIPVRERKGDDAAR